MKKTKTESKTKAASRPKAVKVRLDLPSATGHFGAYGGCFAPETLMPAAEELTQAYLKLRKDASFQRALGLELERFAGRPTPISFAANLTAQAGGARIFLKREDLMHTGSHKINNALGQILVARRMGKKRIIAETGAGQHGVAVATVCAHFGMPAVVYMGEEDVRRQSLNVQRMKWMGAEVVPVSSGSKTLKDAINEAIRDWISHPDDTFYLLGSATGFHPYPLMVRDFQAVIGREARAQFKRQEGRLPDAVVACVNGGSNAIGIFHAFLDDPAVALIGVEAAGDGVATPRTAATMALGKPGVFHGSFSYVLQDEGGQISETHSISAGLDYPGVGPEHSYLRDLGRVEYVSATDADAVDAFTRLCRLEGILPALESSHALAHAIKLAPALGPKKSLLVCLSGRGDKDMASVDQFLDASGARRERS
ncbi:MAG TPA: tryptophan synthase subunit beta [bacterium]|jgi:tryptophan synthase beta chain|nr:tryptophan synthase subunit beta [bacterium]